MKGVDFDQYSYPIIAAPTLRLIVAIANTWHLTIGIADVTNAFQNTLEATYEHDIFD